ncbi:MAG: ABC transporter ATP-binding protein, partial [Planctomycetaceae bacterium]
MEEPFAVETRNLNKVYGNGRTEVVALRQATLRVPKGKVVAL